MKKIVVEGSHPLYGQLHVSGAKNSVLPLIAATLLADGVSTIDESPWLSDVDTMCRVLDHLGAKTNYQSARLSIDTATLNNNDPPSELVRNMRASFLIMGPLLARFGRIRISLPGGCAIGARPIDLHLKGFEAMGADIVLDQGYIEASAKRLHGAQIYLNFPSVGATENLIMAATLADGLTTIHNAAHEPEIIDLSNLLGVMGANIKGAGTNTIRIEGVGALAPATHTVIPDRIEAGSFMVMAAATGGELILNNVVPEHLRSLTVKLAEAGAQIEHSLDALHILGGASVLPVDIKTLPYPGFPTDMQAQMMALLTKASGSGTVTETVFENRFMHATELQKMGADIRINGNTAIINGVTKLHPAQVEATDLRAGAAMIIAAMMAEGVTEIGNIHHIERGYEDICGKLRSVGAKIDIIDV
ncbi:MAG: UDP-N-acetylglucosamine 1-carboxyvinyltransferase [Bacillota bacterium]|nr:UDP-N-acetylglucosamine 1-carboxyvinyltransferase [Bacillota bacterium]